VIEPEVPSSFSVSSCSREESEKNTPAADGEPQAYWIYQDRTAIAYFMSIIFITNVPEGLTSL
jgi:hypothetical protein